MKILVFGKSGQLGNQFYREFGKNKNYIFLNRNDADFTNLEALKKIIYKINPNIIINTAAFTQVDLAEDKKNIAMTVNAKALDVISSSAKELSIYLIHYSTDYVFDGTSKIPYVENDKTNPINYYGKTKLSGEDYIIQSGCNFTIFRTSWVISSSGNNFVKKIIELAKTKENLDVINDQIGVPTSTDFLCKKTIDLINKNEFTKKEIYHLVPNGCTTWFDISKKIVDYFNNKNHNFKLTSKNIIPVKTNSFKSAAKRPLYSRLSNKKISNHLGQKLEHWEIGLNNILNDLILKK